MAGESRFMQTYIPMARRRRPLPRTIYSEAQSKAAHSGSGRCRPHVPFGWAATDAVKQLDTGVRIENVMVREILLKPSQKRKRLMIGREIQSRALTLPAPFQNF